MDACQRYEAGLEERVVHKTAVMNTLGEKVH